MEEEDRCNFVTFRFPDKNFIWNLIPGLSEKNVSCEHIMKSLVQLSIIIEYWTQN